MQRHEKLKRVELFIKPAFIIFPLDGESHPQLLPLNCFYTEAHSQKQPAFTSGYEDQDLFHKPFTPNILEQLHIMFHSDFKLIQGGMQLTFSRCSCTLHNCFF